MKVYIVGGNPQYVRMFTDRGWTNIADPTDADLLQFTGGEDVSPILYGEKNTQSYCNWQRDLYEAGLFAIAQRMGKPMAGICRGGQFLNVMCGGSMIQHVDGHATGKAHEVLDIDTGRIISVTSTHHQMMIADEYQLEEEEASILAYANIRPNEDYDTEVIHYYDPKVLCFQPHPEFGKGECQDYYFELIERCLGLKV